MKHFFDQYFFSPLAAVRPWLLEKCVLLLLALDLWVVRMDEAYRHYEGGLSMAHFAWMDWLLPAVSSATYLGVVFAAGILAIAIALGNLGWGWKLLLTVLYTYTWSASRLDSYQHHYLLSWVLLAIAFFPRMELTQVFSRDNQTSAGVKNHQSVQVYAWAWVLLQVIAAVVYCYTAIAKLDPVWQSGACLAQLQGMQSAMGTFGFAGNIGAGGNPEFWARLASLTVVAELVVALGYLLAPKLDSGASPWVRRTCWACWLVAILLHVGFEVVGLRIGWFSYFMILLTTISFLPAGLLQRVMRPVIDVLGILQSRMADWFALRSYPQLLASAFSMFTAVSLLIVGWWVDLPGVWIAAVLIAVVHLAASGYRLWKGPIWHDQLSNLGVVLGLLIFCTLIWSGPTRAKFYPYRVSQLFRFCEYEACEALLPKAEAYVSANDVHGQFYLAEIYATGPEASLRNPEKAVRYATSVCELVDYENASALEILACAYAAQGDFAEAAKFVRQAVELLSDHQAGSALAHLRELERQFQTETPYFAECSYRYRGGCPE